MEKKNRSFFVFIIFLFLIFTPNENLYANESASFLSLKKNEVYLRQGPSFEYPIKLIYKKKYLPVLLIDKSGPWKKIKDFENNTGWIHTALLSKKKSAINIKKNSIIYKKSTIYSEPIVRLEIGRLVLIDKCKEKWCKVFSDKYKGWILKKYLWGKIN